MNLSEGFFVQFGGLEGIEQPLKLSKQSLARSVLAQIAQADRGVRVELDAAERGQLESALRMIELRALDLMRDWQRDPRSEKGIEFQRLCSHAFDIRRALSQPPEPMERLKFILYLACQGVLGDRTIDVRRYLNEVTWPEEIVDEDDEPSWATKVFAATADALLLIIRKSGWADLDKAARRIAEIRSRQAEFEAKYLQERNGIRQAAALELVAFYHLAKGVEILGVFVGTGEPVTALDEVDFHMLRAIRASDAAGIVELSLLLRWFHAAARSMGRATIWHQLAAYNSKLTTFKKVLADRTRSQPLFELLPPQREAISEVMNVGNRAVVVVLPTSSGKTLLAEFRIIQTKVNVPEAWIAYLVPTRALVNQVTMQLRRDLSPLEIRVEQAVPALEVDLFEDELLEAPDSFDVLVTTPEKLDLLYRSGERIAAGRPLGLVVVDEAHNIVDGERGVNLELLLATLNLEVPDAHFLLLTPFVPDADELARWLDDERSRSVKPHLSVDWQPNDRLVGLVYPDGQSRHWGMKVKTLHTSKPGIELDQPVTVSPARTRDVPISQARQSRKRVAAEAASILSFRDATIVLACSPNDTWDIAREIAAAAGHWEPSQRIELVRKFTASEFGTEFELTEMLAKGIGVHHAGISPDVRFLLEWLMEAGDLRVLVATTALAQGVNFPVSSVVLATHYKPQKYGPGKYAMVPLRDDEFWNIAGRAGRVRQDSLGLVLFASQAADDETLSKYAQDQVLELASALEQMVEEVISLGRELDLRRLVRNDAKWSSFVQFLCHTYRQIGDHARFVAETEMLLRRTYTYRRLSAHKPEIAEQLVEATRNYASQLRDLPTGIAGLVDLTGFSPETVAQLLNVRDQFVLSEDQWSASRLFRAGNDGLANLIGKMLTIPELGIETPRGDKSANIAEIIQSWVNGATLDEIARLHFGYEEDASRRMTDCCRIIFQQLAAKSSWGLAALQKLAGIDVTGFTDEQKAQFRALPAMIYYGCPTVEGVLMRTLGVPRGVAVGLGEAYRKQGLASETGTRLAHARAWLETCPVSTWDAVRRSNDPLNGPDYRNVWRILNGHDPEI